MAFVNLSPKGIFQNSSPTLSIGPGSYDIDGSTHKELMSVLYPKKNAPFMTTEARDPIKDKKTPGKPVVSVTLLKALEITL